ncbi:MAG: VWA domain-containing protein [Bryobacteraceae bacterium]
METWTGPLASETSSFWRELERNVQERRFPGLPIPLLIGLASMAAPQAPPAIDGPAARPFELSVNVDLVVLHATVRDRKGRTAADLRERDFEVYEDGVRQAIRLFRHEDIPLTAGLVIDHSRSMRPKLPEVVAAARTFVKSSGAEDEMFVVNFNEKVTLGLPRAIRFTNRPDELTAAISNMPAAGMTALYDATFEALHRLKAGSRDKKVLIVVSDGADNASARRETEVLKMAGQSGALIYTIGVFSDDDPDRNPGVLKRLARTTGGEAYFPRQLSEVVEICERIAREIRTQYTIGYVSASAAPPGVYRHIRVAAPTAAHGKLVVRTRAGYYPGESTPVKDEGAN